MIPKVAKIFLSLWGFEGRANCFGQKLAGRDCTHWSSRADIDASSDANGNARAFFPGRRQIQTGYSKRRSGAAAILASLKYNTSQDLSMRQPRRSRFHLRDIACLTPCLKRQNDSRNTCGMTI